MLKELHEKMGWIQPQYVISKLNDQHQIKIISNHNKIIGLGNGLRKKDAELSAAENALESLTKRGFSLETADKRKTERNEINTLEYEKQYKRVEEAVRRYDNQGQSEIVKFDIINLKNSKEPQRYTFAINVAYQRSDNDIFWKIIYESTGIKPIKTKLQTMKEFADLYNVDS